MNKKLLVPVQHLSERNEEGIEVRYFDTQIDNAKFSNVVHRDDHYLLIYQKKGQSSLFVDFRSILFVQQSIFVIVPGQVHYGLSSKNASAFLIAVDPSWVDERYQKIFTSIAAGLEPISLSTVQSELISNVVSLLEKLIINGALFHFGRLTIRSLADSCIGLFASIYFDADGREADNLSREVYIYKNFNGILRQKFKEVKRPSEYASALNISTAYLNEAVKKVTGQTVSYWVQNTVMMEAKRLLFYTDLTIKEIAFQLGYEDYTYFIRLFGKTTGLSPNKFRVKHKI